MSILDDIDTMLKRSEEAMKTEIKKLHRRKLRR